MAFLDLYIDKILVWMTLIFAVLGAYYSVRIIQNIFTKNKKDEGIKKILSNTFILLSIGVTLFALGEMIYDFNLYILNIDPYPSLADIPYVIGSIFIILGFANFAYHILIKHKKLAKGYIMTSVMFFVVLGGGMLFFYSNYVIPYQINETYMQIFLDYFYPISDIIGGVLAIMLFIFFKELDIGRPLLYMVIGEISFFVSDSMITIGEWIGIYPTPNSLIVAITDTTYMISYICFLMGFYMFYMKTSSDGKNSNMKTRKVLKR